MTLRRLISQFTYTQPDSFLLIHRFLSRNLALLSADWMTIRMSSSCRFLRPYLHRTLQRSAKPQHAHAYLSFQRRFAQTTSKPADTTNVTHDYEKRVKQLEQGGNLAAYYPLNPRKADRMPPRSVHELFADLESDEVRTDQTVTVLGMYISSFCNERRDCAMLRVLLEIMLPECAWGCFSACITRAWADESRKGDLPPLVWLQACIHRHLR